MSAPPRPKGEQEAMLALGWKMVLPGDYIRHVDRTVYRVLAPYWDESQPLCGLRAENLWTFESRGNGPDMHFETLEAFAVWFAIEQSNN